MHWLRWEFRSLLPRMIILIQQCFNMAAAYQSAKGDLLEYKFISLYKEEAGIAYEITDNVQGLQHNAIMEEFDELYDREQELMYDN